MTKFSHKCSRYLPDGKCRLLGYKCPVKRENREPIIIVEVKEMSCYWFTRDPIEGEREIGAFK